MHKKPLQSVLVKPAGPDCNLRCGYCFYIKKEELFSQENQHRMSVGILEELIKQVMTQGQDQVSFGWQGGEPTLMGLSFFEQAVIFQKKYGQNQIVGNGLQTNGLLIERDWALFLNEYNFLVGLSLDGPEAIHDRYRLTRGGKGSWQAVQDRAKLLLDSGVSVNSLTVVNSFSANYPEEIYSYLKHLGFSYMQFIPCIEPDPLHSDRPAPFSLTPQQFGTFLCRLFDLWLKDFHNGLPAISIRFFDSLLHSYLGLNAQDCTLQPTCGDYVVVEHNGNVYSCDFFVEPDGFLGSITENSLTDLINSDNQIRFGNQKASLSNQCLRCQWLPHCHGGCLKDRLHNHKNHNINYFCESYRQFFNHADNKLKQVSKKVKDHLNKQEQTTHPGSTADRSQKIGRNSPCPCASGKKYKKCCGKLI